MRYKERPCPGCGNVEQQAPQTLCRDCRRQLALGKRREQEIEALEASGNLIQVAVGTRFHYGTGAHLSFLDIKDTDVLCALVRLAGLEDAHGPYKTARHIHWAGLRAGYYDKSPTKYVRATPKQANDIELILNYIELVIKRAYKDGQANGRNLILRLATAGVDDLNRITTGMTR